jgi:hypothetical protein
VKNRRKNPIPIETLRRQIAQIERPRTGNGATPISSGCGPLDRLLPEGGFRPGTLAEWLADEAGGAGSLAVAAARQACRDGGALVVLDPLRRFYPPAAARLGIEPHEPIVVQTDDQADYRWALDQALRCRAVAAVLAWPERLDGRTFRRLQLAAEEGGGLGLLIRPLAARQEPSWADVRLLVEPQVGGGGNSLPPLRAGGKGTVPFSLRENRDSPRCENRDSPQRENRDSPRCETRRENPPAVSFPTPSYKRWVRVHLLRCRGAASGRSIDLEIDNETCSVHLAAQLADPAAAERATGA